MTYPDDIKTADLYILRRGAWCKVDRRRQIRNGRRGGRTMLAAGRLATIRLTRDLRANGLTPVTPLEVSVDYDPTRDEVRVVAEMRAVRLPAGVEPFELPPWCEDRRVITVILPDQNRPGSVPT